MSITLPPPSYPKVRDMAVRCATYYRMELSKLSPGMEIRNIFRQAGSTTYVVPVAMPRYVTGPIKARAFELSQCPLAQALAGYVWSHDFHYRRHWGTRVETGQWERATWDHQVLTRLVYKPLIRALAAAALTAALAGKPPVPWKLSIRQLYRFIDDSIVDGAERAKGYRTLQAICPLFGLHVSPWTVVLASFKATLTPTASFAVPEFETRYSEYVLDPMDFAAPRFSDCIVTLEWANRTLNMNLVAEEAGFRLNLIKWALTCVSSDHAVTVPSEGVCLVTDRDGHVLTKFQRNDWMSSRGKMMLGRGELARATKLAKSFEHFADIAPKLKDALWFFGRSCASSLARDRLLEAAVGIDALTTNRAPEVRYRFKLHTAVLLHAIHAPEADNALNGILGKIFDERSGAAHGGAQSLSGGGLAAQACMLLARTIEAIVSLAHSSVLPLKRTTTLYDAIELFVRSRATK